MFAGIDVRVTLDGRQPDQISVTENILRHVFEGVAPGKHSVTASDVMGFSDSREIVLDPPPETPTLTSAALPTTIATPTPEAKETPPLPGRVWNLAGTHGRRRASMFAVRL